MSTVISNEELAGRIATALGLFSSCIKSGEDWSPQCEQVQRDAFDALRQLGERLPAARVRAGETTVNQARSEHGLAHLP